MSGIYAPMSEGGKPFIHDTPCPVCSGRVKTEPDPDSNSKLPQCDITYCRGCGEIFSPWTMIVFRETQMKKAKREGKRKAAA